MQCICCPLRSKRKGRTGRRGSSRKQSRNGGCVAKALDRAPSRAGSPARFAHGAWPRRSRLLDDCCRVRVGSGTLGPEVLVRRRTGNDAQTGRQDLAVASVTGNWAGAWSGAQSREAIFCSGGQVAAGPSRARRRAMQGARPIRARHCTPCHAKGVSTRLVLPRQAPPLPPGRSSRAFFAIRVQSGRCVARRACAMQTMDGRVRVWVRVRVRRLAATVAAAAAAAAAAVASGSPTTTSTRS